MIIIRTKFAFRIKNAYHVKLSKHGLRNTGARFGVANQFTEHERRRHYDKDRWIVNKVTFYLTFY